MTSNPKVSILVPVYNAEKFLRRFMESALQQVFQDYEIICVDNWSTDNSFRILKEYEREFPEKVFVYQTDVHGGVGKGRNTAFRHANGEYIFWCDSDDMLHPLALKMLVEEADRCDSDMVVGWAKTVIQDSDGNITKICDTSKKLSQAASNVAAISSGVEFWLRLIRKSLIEQIGPMLETVVFDDVSYLPVVQSYARNIRYINFPIYYFFRRQGSACTVPIASVSHDSVIAEKYALEHCNPEYQNAVERFVAHRIRFNLDFRWQFYDVYIDWLKELMPTFEKNDYIKNDCALYKRLKFASSLTDNVIPNEVYVSGFEKRPSDERIEEIKEKAFHDGCTVTILSEDNCDIYENNYIAEAYANGDYITVSQYFAVKSIYEKGGFYLDENIRIINCFNSCKYHNAMFAFIDDETFSDHIFAAPANNPVFQDILKTFSHDWDKNGKYISLSERIQIILTIKYDIPLDGKARLFGAIVSVLSPDMCTVDTRFGVATQRTICEHNFTEQADEEEYVTIRRSTLKWLIKHNSPAATTVKQHSNAEQELKALKQTNTYKMMMKIRKIGDGPMGPFLKKIFHGILKIREKMKRK